jgi:curli biogenesis system outer membrane secretion channel CsgG
LRASARPGRKLVAIAGFENKSTYGADKLSDSSGQLLTATLLEMGAFRLVEWERMKQLFTWHELSTNALVKSPEKRAEARKILLTEYFLTGAITQFDVKQASEVSALSKRKTYTTHVRVDLQMQDSATGEYVSGASGQSTSRQDFSGDITGGQTGSWDPKTADTALDEAIRQALTKLVDNYRRNVGD